MADLESALANVPGLAGYLGQEQFTQRRNTATLANANQAATLQDHMGKVQRERGLREALANVRPDASDEEKLQAILPFVGADNAFKTIEGRRAREAALEQTNLFRQLAEDRKAAELRLREREQGGRDAVRAYRDLPPGAAPQQGPLPSYQEAMQTMGGGKNAPFTMQVDPASPQPIQESPAPTVAIPPQAVPAEVPVAPPAAPVQGAPVARGEVPPAQGAPVARGVPKPPPELEAEWAKLPRGGPKGSDATRAKWISDRLKESMSAATKELPPLTGDALVSAGAQHRAGMPLTQVIPGMGRHVTERRDSVRQEAIRQIQAENPGMGPAAAGQELINQKIAAVASNKSVGQLTTMLGATRQAVDQLDYNVNKVTEAMGKLPSGKEMDISPVITAISRGASKWSGDPAYSELFYFMSAAAMESARILQGGQASVAQLHQGAADEAKKWADANWTTPKAWKEGVAPAMKAEGAERIKTYERAIEKQRLGASRTPAPSAVEPTSAGKPTTKQIADAGWGYEPEKYEYRMVGGKVQRKAK